MSAHWLFGYGSLIWRPGFDFIDAQPARLPGYARRFWQGSHDHRGVPEAPGRVVTLIEEPAEECHGMAYLIEGEVVADTFEQLDYREKNGYERIVADLHLATGETVRGLVYIAVPGNFAYLGEAPLENIARQIVGAVGPSGRNVDYLNELAAALRRLEVHDEHVFALESLAADLRQHNGSHR